MNKFMVYYVCTDGAREGQAVIEAPDRSEAIRKYKMFYNVNDQNIRAVPRFEITKSKEEK